MKLGEGIAWLFKNKKVRFLFVGGLNTLVGYGSYALFIFLGLNPYFATTLSTIIGVINSYFWNKYFTFRVKEKSIGEAIRFIVVYAVSYAVNLSLIYIFVDVLGLNAYVAGAICLLMVTIISYVGHHYFSFKQ